MVLFGKQVDPIDHTFEGIAEIVNHDDIVVRLQKFQGCVTSDVTKPPGD